MIDLNLQTALITLMLTALLAGCGDEPKIRTEPVQLSGRIIAPGAAAEGNAISIRLYHAWALEGELRHPVEFITGFETAPGAYAFEFDYPVDQGDGLLVYAWLDKDGDGVLCTPDSRIDVAGLTDVEDFHPGAVVANVEVIAPCAGPDWFYPPA